ncbi:TonB-dependent receptor [Shewanella sp. A3A]|nr:TonB-dependent receptor [Shewanella ferrihydritica]
MSPTFAPPKPSMLASAIVCALGFMPLAHAEDTPKTSDDEQIERISVTYQASLAKAASMKKEDTKVTDVITSEDIGKFPTENIAEAIQRIPGVQISNINGRGSTISVRGLGAQYAKTTVNGQTLASADFTSGFRYDIIQSELASSIEVIKSPTADMDTGGLSGTVNIDTTSPLSYTERKILTSIKGQYSEYSPTDNVTPKGNVTYIDQFNDNTLGVFLNAGYQKLDDRVDNAWMGRWFTTDDGEYFPRRPRFRRIDRETNRYLGNGAIQWRPFDHFETKLTAIYAKDETDQDLNQQVFLFNRDQIELQGEPTDGVYTKEIIRDFTLENNRQMEQNSATSEAFTWDAKYDTDYWTFSGVAHYTKGKATHSEEAAILATVIPEATLDISNRSMSFVLSEDLTDPALYPMDMPRNEYPNGQTQFMNADETAFQADALRTFDDGFLRSIKFGVKYRKEKFERSVYRTDRAAIGEAADEDLPPMSDYNFMVRDFLDGEMNIPSAWIAPDIQAYRDALAAEGVVVPTFFAAQSSYSVTRNILAAYAEANFDTFIGDMPFRGNVGMRYETTDRDIDTYLTGDVNPQNEEIREVIGTYTTNYDYHNFLPSMNLVLEMTDEVLARVAAAKVLVRPILTSNTQIAASESSSANSFGTRTYTINLGQPEMKAMTANQVDLGLEWYYGNGNSLTMTLFWKEIMNGTVTDFVCPSQYNGTELTGTGAECTDVDGNIFEISSTYNTATSIDLKGYEIGWNQSLDAWLPIAGFGINANFTYIDADESEDFELTNSSERTWNVIAYWENDTFSARVAMNHRSPYVQDSSDSFFAREGRVVDGREQVDVILGYSPTENIDIRFGAINVTGKNEEAYFADTMKVWQTTSAIGRSYYMNLMYSF